MGLRSSHVSRTQRALLAPHARATRIRETQMPERSQLRRAKRGGLSRATAEHGQHERESKPLFAIVACVKASTASWVHSTIQSLQDTALVRVLLPSLTETINATEAEAWRLRLYLCADDDDWLYARGGTQREIRARMPDWLELRLLKIRAQRQRVPNREAALAAYRDGAEYIHRTNDDIRYFTQGWITAAVGVLRSLDPPNLGVVGPRVYGDGMRAIRLLTLDVVHRTHLELFAEYYPPQLDNWFVDDWISFTCACLRVVEPTLRKTAHEPRTRDSCPPPPCRYHRKECAWNQAESRGAVQAEALPGGDLESVSQLHARPAVQCHDDEPPSALGAHWVRAGGRRGSPHDWRRTQCRATFGTARDRPNC